LKGPLGGCIFLNLKAGLWSPPRHRIRKTWARPYSVFQFFRKTDTIKTVVEYIEVYSEPWSNKGYPDMSITMTKLTSLIKIETCRFVIKWIMGFSLALFFCGFVLEKTTRNSPSLRDNVSWKVRTKRSTTNNTHHTIQPFPLTDFFYQLFQG
jgi:hypothetical protein